MIMENQDNNKQTGLGEVGSRLVSLYPDFDVRSYGYSSLSKFFEEFDRIQLVKKGHVASVALKENRAKKEDVDQYVRELVKSNGATGLDLAAIGNRVYDKYKDFKLNDYGYSQFKKYVKSISHLKLEQDGKVWRAYYKK